MDIKKVYHYINRYSSRVLTIAITVVLILQFIMFVHAISKSVSTWPVINAYNNDAANAIRVSESSNWLRDNGWYPYGNLYFNLSNMIAQFDPLKSGRDIGKNDFINDEGHHFALMMVSLCSLYGISLLLSLIITHSLVWRLFSIFVLNTVFMKSNYWVTWVFIAHPDLLLSFLIAWAFYLTFKYMTLRKPIFFFGSAIVWGFALAAKMTTIIFLPMLICLFLPPVNKQSFINIFKYYGVMVISYMAIGFPQNLKIWKHIEHLNDQNRYLLSPTLESASEWFHLLLHQSILILIVIFVLVGLGIAIGATKRTGENKLPLWRAGLMLLFPFVFYLTRNIVNPHEHYTLPIAAGLSMFAVFLAHQVYKAVRLKAWVTPVGNRNLLLILFVAVVLLFRFTPNAVPEVLNAQSQGRNEAKAFVETVSSYQKQNRKILADPYVPWNENLGNVSVSYYRTFADIKQEKAQVLVLARNFYGRYLEESPSDYVKSDARNWREVHQFYRLFAGKEDVTDPHGQRWLKQYSCPQGWEIWVLQDANATKSSK